MGWDVVRVAVVPAVALTIAVITQPPIRMFVGTVMAAMGAIGLLVAALVHDRTAIPTAAGSAAAVAIGIALVWWGYDRTQTTGNGDST